VLNAWFENLISNSQSLTLAPNLILLIFLLCSIASYSQSAGSIFNNPGPGKWPDAIKEELHKLENRIIAQSEHTIRKLRNQEAKLIEGLSTLDSATAATLLSETRAKYQQLSDQINSKSSLFQERLTREYLPYLDSLNGGLLFLNSNKNLLLISPSSRLKDALDALKDFQNKLQQANAIKQFVRERKQQLNELLGHYSSLNGKISKALKNYSKEFYYYSEQIREYKEMFHDPDKFLSKPLALLNKMPAFQQFMKEHSELGNLFSLPLNYGSALATSGLQTKIQVQQMITDQIGSGSTSVGQIFNRQIQSAQTQLEQFKQKINALGGNSGDVEMPDFQPNTQHKKTFFERLELGTNIQTSKANFIFPSTTDLAFTLGYKIDDKKIVGIGIAGKIGWGKDIQHVTVTGQGLSVRSFIDLRIKNSFYASGGLEYNYQQPFSEIQQLHDLDMWSTSGLIGITKIISIKSKVFKKTKIQLLWDFLSYRQLPGTDPIKFRVGYNF